MNGPKTAGLTMLEILAVLMVLAILMGVGFTEFAAAQRRATLRDSVQQLAADLRQARSAAQRFNQNNVVTLDSSGQFYTRTLQGVTSRRDLPQNFLVSVVSPSGGSSVTYQAPYGTLGATGVVWQMTSPNSADSMFIKVVGVTGKVIVSATN